MGHAARDVIYVMYEETTSMRCSLDGPPRNPDRNSNLAQELCGMAVIYDIYAPTVIYAR